MTSSLVGSEMCIRDSLLLVQEMCFSSCITNDRRLALAEQAGTQDPFRGCLLYTSDAADDM
eukprot:7314733-Prorocentrum_lima.AAC.1